MENWRREKWSEIIWGKQGVGNTAARSEGKGVSWLGANMGKWIREVMGI
jgi:hypothetical protein